MTLQPLDAGTAVGPYRIQDLLGQGGMGVVYRAIDTRLNRPVAIKFLSSDAVTPAEQHRFQREAQTASSLNHPHIITVHDAGAYDGRQYFVTELADAGTLTGWLRSRRSWRETTELLIGIADALAAAHEAGILHRDFKPDNVLLTKSGYAKLADFGLARHVAASDGATQSIGIDRTRAGAIVGTAHYMSPEQAAGSPIDARSDVFSFGIVLHEALTGSRPFSGGTVVDVLHAIVHDPPSPLSPSLPLPLRMVVEKALEKKPADRYQSMRDVVVDLRRAIRHGGDAADVAAVRGWRWRRQAIVGAAVAVIGVGALWLVRQPARRVTQPRLEYTPLTTFADSVVAPALSRDGRILAFIRGDNPFVGPGEIYVKLLPDGEPSQLTHDQADKMGPLVFSPDGARLAYTIGNTSAWTVPILGGEPKHVMENAGGMSWVGGSDPLAHRVVFSALAGQGIHMGVYTSTENRGDERTVYLPADVNGMAHRSFLSPDRKSMIVVEMDMLGWLPCRVVPFEGGGMGRTIGPARSQCTDAAWSPDGKWMYVSANAGGGFHIWRQAFPDGAPEQVTSGATEEQGIVVDPDGQSFLTAVGETQSTLWVHAGETRQVTFEGFAYMPSFSGDRRRLFYLQRTKADRRFVSGELWVADLQTGTRQRLVPGSLMENYDVSRDGKRVVFVDVDESGRSSIWEATLDGSTPPKRLSSFEGVRVLFGPNDDVFFVGGETTSLYLYRLAPDGTPRRVFEAPANFLYDVSPDGKWVAAWVGTAVAFYPVDGGASILVCQHCGTAGEENRGVTPPLVRWSKDGRFLYLYSWEGRQTFEAALPPGAVVPPMPPGGFPDMAHMAAALHARPLADQRAFVGPDAGWYAFPRVVAHRNIYRVKAS